jgi:predicted HTH domain antitoxin
VETVCQSVSFDFIAGKGHQSVDVFQKSVSKMFIPRGADHIECDNFLYHMLSMLFEALAIEGYRSEKLTHHEAARLLAMTRFEFDGFLQDRQIYDHAYSLEDLERDLADLDQLRAKGLLG